MTPANALQPQNPAGATATGQGTQDGPSQNGPSQNLPPHPTPAQHGPAHWEATITAFLQRHLSSSGADGVVVGVSGGLDSAVVAALAVRALGPEKVLPLILPAPDSDPQDEQHARLVCTSLGLTPHVIPIGPILQGFDEVHSTAQQRGEGGSKKSDHDLLPVSLESRIRGNAKSRSRMLLLYAEAQGRNRLVCGTSNKSELLAGYFTKWGDGASDMNPIGDLYKGQVRELAVHLGVPRQVIDKPPSAGLYPGQTDEGDMGLSYADLDAVLRGIELNLDLATIARKTALPLQSVEKVEAMVRRTEHKRRLPLIPKIGARTVGIDWRRSVQWR